MSALSAITWPIRAALHIVLQPDKVAHFYFGATVGYAGLWMGWWGLALVTLAGASKELYDLVHPPHECDGWDFVATMLGGACAIELILWRLHYV